jgi:SHS2 domain-containing protein
LKNNNYEILDSTSELRIKVFGKSIKELFSNALKAMFESIEPRYVAASKEFSHEISIQAKDKDILLVDFLSEALVHSDINNEAYLRVVFEEINDQKLKAQIFGKKVCGFTIEIKAVTYHGVKIEEKNRKLFTEIIFDI